MKAASITGPQAHDNRRFDGSKLLSTACVAVPLLGLTVFFLYPMAIVFFRSITLADGTLGIANYQEILQSSGFWRATQHSMVMGAATTLLTVVLGFLIAQGLHRAVFPGKNLLRIAITLPLLAPSLVQALGLIFLLGRNGLVNRLFGWELDIYGFWGLLIANTLYALPQAVMIIGAGLVLLDARIYEAAEVMGSSPGRQFRDLTLPGVLFAVLNTAFVVFIITITDFGNAAVIGGDYSVLATEIYSQVVGLRNFNMGAVVGIMLLIPTVVAYYIESKSVQKQALQKASSVEPYIPRRHLPRDIPVAASCYAIAAAIFSVVGIVVYASFVKLWPYNFDLTFKHYNITIADGYGSLWTTIGISLIAAAVGTAAVFAMAIGERKLPDALKSPVQILAAMPAAVPGMVLGLAYILTFNSTATPLYLLYGTAALIAAVNFYHYHTQAYMTVMTGFRQFPAELEEAAESIGAGFGRVAMNIVAPFLAPMLIAVFFFLFMRSMVTLSAVIFLTTPELTVAAVTIMRLDDAGLTSQAAAFSTAVMLVVAGALLLMKLVLSGIARYHAYKRGQERVG